MNGLEFLDLVIGLVFIYLIYSIACSAIWELVIIRKNKRGKMLAEWLRANFQTDKDDIAEKMLNHPLVKGLSPKKGKDPSYISSEVFADILLEIAGTASGKEGSGDKQFTFDELRERISTNQVLNKELQSMILLYFDQADKKIGNVTRKIRTWYDEAQEELIGSYKKNLQGWIFGISVILVFSTNADTFRLASYLYSNDAAREAIATKAAFFVQDTAVAGMIARIDTSRVDQLRTISDEQFLKKLNRNFETLKTLDKELKEAEIPVGWKKGELKSPLDWLRKVGGLLITALAVSLGSPFWFDILSKLSNLRAAGKKPQTLLEKENRKAGNDNTNGENP